MAGEAALVGATTAEREVGLLAVKDESVESAEPAEEPRCALAHRNPQLSTIGKNVRNAVD